MFLWRAKLKGLAVTQDGVDDVREFAHGCYASYLFGLLHALLLIISSENRILVCAAFVPRNAAYRHYVQHRAHLGRVTLGQLVPAALKRSGLSLAGIKYEYVTI